MLRISLPMEVHAKHVRKKKKQKDKIAKRSTMLKLAHYQRYLLYKKVRHPMLYVGCSYFNMIKNSDGFLRRNYKGYIIQLAKINFFIKIIYNSTRFSWRYAKLRTEVVVKIDNISFNCISLNRW